MPPLVQEFDVAILLTCTCGKKLKIDDCYAGKQGRCPACGGTLDIPTGERRGPPPLPPEVRAVPPPLPGGNGPAAPPYPAAPPAAPPPPAEGQRGPLLNHGGGELPQDADFFVPPPPEIGELLSAYTNMRQHDDPWTPAARVAWAVLGTAIGVLIPVILALLIRGLRHPVPLILLPLGLGGGGLAIALWATGFKRTCTYVGREGVARFVCRGSRDNLTTRRLFLFRDAMELRTALAHQYLNGAYQGTNYSYTWTDVGGVVRFKITGRHNSERGTPKLTHDYYFATGAEIAWTIHLLSQLEAKLNLGGSVTFHVNKNDWVRVSPGHLRFSFKGETMDCPVSEIGEARVEGEMFTIKRIDAREGWFSSEGVFKFPYSQLGNAQLFRIVLDKWAGVRLN